MTPLWPEYELEISRKACVEDDGTFGLEGEVISLFQHDAAAILLRTIAPNGKEARVIRLAPRGSGGWSNESLTEWAEETGVLKLHMEDFLRTEGLI